MESTTSAATDPVAPKIAKPRKGIATYINEFGYRVIIWHYSSDPMKDEEWAANARAQEPDPEHWDQEMELSHEVIRGRLTYYAFSERRNLIEDLPCSVEEFRRDWDHSLSVDYGEGASPTSWLFWAEHKRTKELLIYDEVYVHTSGPNAWPEHLRQPEPIAKVVYDRARHWFGISPEVPLNLKRYYRYAIGDPSGRGFAIIYATCSYPIHVGDASTLPKNLPKINDVEAGEIRVNTFLSPGFLCCPNQEGKRLPIFAERGVCPICKQERAGRPRLRILRTRCPMLVLQLKTVRKKLSTKPEDEDPTRDAGMPNHSTDSCKYGAMTHSPTLLEAEQLDLSPSLVGPERDLARFMDAHLKRLEREQKVAARGYAPLTWDTPYSKLPSDERPRSLEDFL